MGNKSEKPSPKAAQRHQRAQGFGKKIGKDTPGTYATFDYTDNSKGKSSPKS